MILDIHTHKSPPRPEALISADAGEFRSYPGQAFSAGVHPWLDMEPASRSVERLREVARLPEVLAIGECGLDLLRGAPMYHQMLTFRACILTAAEVSKPMIVHDVRSHAQLIRMHREYAPESLWAIHGFRGKPAVAEMLLAEGFYLSFGPRFNPESLEVTPQCRILAETDDSPLDIGAVIGTLAAARPDIADMRGTIAANTTTFLANTIST